MLPGSKIDSFKRLKTPFFYYDLEILEETLTHIRFAALDRGYHVHYALKANNQPKILKTIKNFGLGADCVSGNEVLWALKHGFAPENIAFAGVGKTDEEIRIGLSSGVACFNCESVQEMQVINEIAASEGRMAPVAIRINPNVDAQTHKYITTGLNENKFGVAESELPSIFEQMKQWKNLELKGIHFHIGSQIIELSPFRRLCERAGQIAEFMHATGFPLEIVNVGGGLGINYENPDEHPIPDLTSYFGLFERHLPIPPGAELHFELGRSIVGQCGSLLTRVLYIKKGMETTFAIVDAGMSELIRPALYQAMHHIDVFNSSKNSAVYDVVGPICESSDTFRARMELPVLSRGDLLAIRSSGAYGQVMMSNYNMRPKVGTYFSDEV